MDAARWRCARCEGPVYTHTAQCPRCGCPLDATTRVVDRPPGPAAADGRDRAGADDAHPVVTERGSFWPSGAWPPVNRPDVNGLDVDGLPMGTIAARRCTNPGCRARLTGPDDASCPVCGTELPPPSSTMSSSASSMSPTSSTAPASASPPGPGRLVELHFEAGVVVVPAGAEVVLGRQGTLGSGQLLGDLAGVSRVHARVRVRPDGTAEVRDAVSANGTYLDGVRVASQWCDLPDGAELALASVTCRVHYR